MKDHPDITVLRETLNTISGGKGHWTLSDKLFESRRARIYRADNTATGQAICIKKSKSETSPDRQLVTEYENLKTLWQEQETPDAPQPLVPQPYGLLPEPGILLMEWVELPAARDTLKGTGPTSAVRGQVIRTAAHWLKRFHQITATRRQNFNGTKYIKRLDASVGHKPAIQKDIQTCRLFNRHYQTLSTLVPEVERLLSDYAGRHGDFAPRNLLSNGERTIGIDISTGYVDSVLEDICWFSNELLLRHNPFPVFRKNHLTAPAATFFKHYYQDKFQTDSAPQDEEIWTLFLFIGLYEMLSRWLSVLNRIRKYQMGASNDKIHNILWCYYFLLKVKALAKLYNHHITLQKPK
ncbi:phosphotransferase [Sneathiella chinensis]|uniref:Aminoglycoside phosphotransferase domain-containing protein n=1 Tax=Sneathiella chinensis TaxID=349750 RepID=A0ABQ5U0W2_9PROT|nr:phosphotransferase [Sneathiella chinensis]GLQ05752.1 hypothetical protein GCM10007924_09730 [Sneathiella chinensis]